MGCAARAPAARPAVRVTLAGPCPAVPELYVSSQTLFRTGCIAGSSGTSHGADSCRSPICTCVAQSATTSGIHAGCMHCEAGAWAAPTGEWELKSWPLMRHSGSHMQFNALAWPCLTSPGHAAQQCWLLGCRQRGARGALAAWQQTRCGRPGPGVRRAAQARAVRARDPDEVR